jgi:DNA polymerase
MKAEFLTLKEEVLQCTGCGLSKTRHHVIFGEGNPDEEAEACMPYLLEQIRLVDPKIMILLGATALRHMFGPERRITLERGHWLDWNGRLAMPVYHPAALLRDPALKRPTWEDFKKIVAKYRELVDPQHYSQYT